MVKNFLQLQRMLCRPFRDSRIFQLTALPDVNDRTVQEIPQVNLGDGIQSEPVGERRGVGPIYPSNRHFSEDDPRVIRYT